MKPLNKSVEDLKQECFFLNDIDHSRASDAMLNEMFMIPDLNAVVDAWCLVRLLDVAEREISRMEQNADYGWKNVDYFEPNPVYVEFMNGNGGAEKIKRLIDKALPLDSSKAWAYTRKDPRTPALQAKFATPITTVKKSDV